MPAVRGSLYVGEENSYDVITGNSIVSGAALLVFAGGVTLVVSAVGMVGAFGMWRPSPSGCE